MLSETFEVLARQELIAVELAEALAEVLAPNDSQDTKPATVVAVIVPVPVGASEAPVPTTIAAVVFVPLEITEKGAAPATPPLIAAALPLDAEIVE